jgi:hypothetical protein
MNNFLLYDILMLSLCKWIYVRGNFATLLYFSHYCCTYSTCETEMWYCQKFKNRVTHRFIMKKCDNIEFAVKIIQNRLFL